MMAQTQIYLGTPAQLVKQISKLPAAETYQITVTHQEAETESKQSKMITFGMFPQLQSLTEGDFKGAEWHGEEIELS
jgi:hypothetical protein